MIEHFWFVSLGQVVGDLAVDEKKAVQTIATIWHRTLYGALPPDDDVSETIVRPTAQS